jgi:hypothetical protein
MQLGNFSFKIVNGDSVSHTVVLLPGSYPVIGLSGADVSTLKLHYHDPAAIKNAGNNIDYVLDDGEIDDAGKVTCTPSDAEFEIQHFLQHIKNNPYKVGQIMVQADNEDVFNEKIVVQRDNPTMGTSKRFIKFSDYFKPTQFQNQKIVIEEPNIFLSDETFMFMAIPAGRTVTMHYNRLMKLV